MDGWLLLMLYWSDRMRSRSNPARLEKEEKGKQEQLRDMETLSWERGQVYITVNWTFLLQPCLWYSVRCQVVASVPGGLFSVT